MCYRCVFILDTSAPAFDVDVPLYRHQLEKDLVMNVYSNGQWGSYRHLPLDSYDTVPVPHAYVNVTTRGDLSSLKWIEGKLQPDRYVINTEFGSADISVYINMCFIFVGSIILEVMGKWAFCMEYASKF